MSIPLGNPLRNPLRNPQRNSQRNWRRKGKSCQYAQSVCAPSSEEVLLACGLSGVRTMSLNTGRLSAHEPFNLRDVWGHWGAAYDAHTDTLLLLVTAENRWQRASLVSLRRNASEWLEVQRLNTEIIYYDVHMAVCDSIVLLGANNVATLTVFEVSANHSLHDVGNVTLPQHIRIQFFRGLACTRRDNDTLVAIINGASMSLLLLAPSLPLRLEPLASVNYLNSRTYPSSLLFRGDLLLVAEWNAITETHDIVSLRASGNESLTERRLLLEEGKSVGVRDWTLAGDRLVVIEWQWDLEWDNLLLFDFV